MTYPSCILIHNIVAAFTRFLAHKLYWKKPMRSIASDKDDSEKDEKLGRAKGQT